MIRLMQIGGIVLILVGLVWFFQGINVLLGSVMSGKPIFSVLGAILAIVGIWLIRNSVRVGGAPSRR